MSLVIEDELPGQGRGSGRGRVRLFRFRWIDFEQLSVHFVHRHEGSGHAARGAQELPPVETQLAPGFVGQILEPAFNLALLRGFAAAD